MVPVGLLEVVADERVELVGALLEPVGVALVQARALGLRDRVVGGVAEQEVAEAEARPRRRAPAGRGG